MKLILTATVDNLGIAGDVVEVKKSERSTLFIRFGDTDIFRLIREKLA